MKSATILLGLLGAVRGEKQFVFVAGPQRSDSTGVSSFFQEHATGDTSQNNGLDGWIWPQIEEQLPGEKHRYFEHFFWSTHNDTIQSILMDSIQDAWEHSEHGVIIGAEGFDNTRGASQSIGLSTMHKILDTLNIPPEQVVVVMLYKSPRLDQWISLYHHNAPQSYENFVCKAHYTEHLADIPMNPFMLAGVYRNQGWKVAIVDNAGTHQKGDDLTHAIACKVLPHTGCENNRIRNLQDEETEEESSDFGEFNELPSYEKNQLEGLFQSRDCYYKATLEQDDGFSIVHQLAAWEKCGTTAAELQHYMQLTDVEYFFDLIQSQMGCSNSTQPNLRPTINDIPAEQSALTETQPYRSWNQLKLTALFASVLFVMFLIYYTIARVKRRQTNYIKSPTGTAVWVDFAEDAFKIENNLRGASGDDDSLSEVDLASPKFQASKHKESAAVNGGNSNLDMTAVAKKGRSVRGKYRVGLYQDEAVAARTKPQRGDSDFEFKIKTLEQEIA